MGFTQLLLFIYALFFIGRAVNNTISLVINTRGDSLTRTTPPTRTTS